MIYYPAFLPLDMLYSRCSHICELYICHKFQECKTITTIGRTVSTENIDILINNTHTYIHYESYENADISKILNEPTIVFTNDLYKNILAVNIYKWCIIHENAIDLTLKKRVEKWFQEKDICEHYDIVEDLYRDYQ